MAVETSDQIIDDEIWPPQPSKLQAALLDLGAGLRQSWLWTALAQQDIRLRYRGSVLGPFWLTVSIMFTVGAMGVLYARLFGFSRGNYIPYLAIGLIVWQFVTTTITDGCRTFFSVQPIIHQVRMPFSVHVYRLLYRNLLVLAHNAVIVPIVLLLFGIPFGWHSLLFLPGLAVLVANGFWISILFGMLSARYRDIPPIVTNLVQLLFFVTPVFWSASTLGPQARIVELNPLFAAVDVVRAPLLGVVTAPSSWPELLVLTLCGLVGTFAFFARFRSRIAFWV